MYTGKFRYYKDFKEADNRYRNWRERSFLPDMPHHIRRIHRNLMLDCYGSVNRTYGNFYIDRNRIIPPRYDVIDDHYDKKAFQCDLDYYPREPRSTKEDYSNNYLWRRHDVNELHLPDVVNVDMQIHTHHGDTTEILRSAEGGSYVLNTPVKHMSLRGADIKAINLEFMNRDKSIFHLSANPVDYDYGLVRRN